MEDQHNSVLHKYYEETFDEAKKYIEQKLSAKELSPEDTQLPENITERYKNFFRVCIQNKRYPQSLIIAIPKYFPDQLPKIYLSKEDYLKTFPLPHVDKNRMICTRDPNIAYINETKPGEAIEYLIEIALEIVNSGLNKENLEDFNDEFLAYWNEQAKYTIFSLFKPLNEIETIKIIELSKKLLKSEYLLVRELKEADNWLRHLDIKYDKNKVHEALYLPLRSQLEFPLPNTNGHIYSILKQADETFCYALERFLNASSANKIVIFSLPFKGEKILAGWKFSGWKSEVFNGFRKNQIPLEIRLCKSYKNFIEKISIERIDRERLFKRGGIGIDNSIIDSSIAIVGCGSLGSPIAISLSKSGFSNFLLVDDDILEPGNIARHVCGFDEIYKSPLKSEALQQRLTKHFPYIECVARSENILDLLSEDIGILNNYNLTIIAIGDKGTERRLNYLIRTEIIKRPLVFIWMEPYGIAGHLLYIHPNKGGCFNCTFNEKGYFKYSVAKENQNFLIRESGCQSTFYPYSNLDIESFANIVTRRIILCIKEEPKRSFLLTWIGDQTLFKSRGFEINDEWAAKLSFSSQIVAVEKNENCEVCKEK